MEQVNPEMLILARESRGMSQVDLAREVGVTQGKISKYENGALNVSPEDLAQIAKALHYMEEFFFQKATVYGLGSSFLFHRQRQSIPIKVQRRIQSEVNIWRMQVERLLRGAVVNCENRFAAIDIDSVNGDAQEAARRVRAAWKIPVGPIGCVVAAIESAGGIVIKCPFATRKMDAAHLWLPGLPPLFFVNRDLPGDRLRFTLMHEVGHATMHEGVAFSAVEKEADEFAAEFLMPGNEISASLRDMTIEKAARLKPLWKVSMAALIKHAYDLRRISQVQYHKLFSQLSALGYRMNEPLPIPVEEPTVLRELLAIHRTSLGYTDADLAALLFTADAQFFEPTETPIKLRLADKRQTFVIRRESEK